MPRYFFNTRIDDQTIRDEEGEMHTFQVVSVEPAA